MTDEAIRQVRETLSAALGAKAVLMGADIPERNRNDWSSLAPNPPAILVRPETTQAVATVEIDPAAATMTVLAWTPLQVVQAAADEADLYFALDLGARGSCAIGGNVRRWPLSVNPPVRRRTWCARTSATSWSTR